MASILIRIGGDSYKGPIVSHKLKWEGHPLNLEHVAKIEIRESGNNSRWGDITLKDGSVLKAFKNGFWGGRKAVLKGVVIVRIEALGEEFCLEISDAEHVWFLQP